MTRLQVRRGTSLQWASTNPILAAGEPGLDTTTGLLKIGDGISSWGSLLAEWAPASMVAQVNALPRGVLSSAIGTAIDGIALSNVSTVFLTNNLLYTFETGRRYRIWYTIRALTAGGLRMGLTLFGAAFGSDQYFSSDRSYDGATLNWFVTGVNGTTTAQIFSYSGATAGATIYGKDFYIEDVGGG